MQQTISSTTLFPIIVVLVVAFAVYFNALYNKFVYDDIQQVVDNQWIRDVRHLPDIFLHSVWSFESENRLPSNYYRPLMHSIYMLNYYVFGLAPWGFHLVNILFHAGNTLLVFIIASRFFGKSGHSSPAPIPTLSSAFFSVPFIAALLFAAHPIHTEAVTWVAGLPDVSFTFFFLLSFYCYMRSGEGKQGRKWFYAVSVGLFFLSALCKEPALTLPVILMGYDYAARKNEGNFYVCLKRYAPYLMAAVAYIILRFKALGGVAPSDNRHGYLTTYQYIINIFPLFRQYLEKLFMPVNLNAFYVLHPILSLSNPEGIIALFITLVFILLAFFSLKKHRMIFLSILIIAIPLVPVLYIPVLGENTFADRYLYLPSFGFVLLASLAIMRIKTMSRGTVIASCLLVVITGFYAFGTIARNSIWKDDYSLFYDTVKKSPDSAIARNTLGNAYVTLNKPDEAMEQYLAAIKLQPHYALAYNNLGHVYQILNKPDKAIEQYMIAIEMRPDYFSAYNNLGNAYMTLNKPDKALEQYLTAVKLKPDYALAYNNLGYAYVSLNQLDKAVEQYLTAIRLRPDIAEAYFNLGRVYRYMGQMEKARAVLAAGLRVKPNDQKTWQVLQSIPGSN